MKTDSFTRFGSFHPVIIARLQHTFCNIFVSAHLFQTGAVSICQLLYHYRSGDFGATSISASVKPQPSLKEC